MKYSTDQISVVKLPHQVYCGEHWIPQIYKSDDKPTHDLFITGPAKWSDLKYGTIILINNKDVGMISKIEDEKVLFKKGDGYNCDGFEYVTSLKSIRFVMATNNTTLLINIKGEYPDRTTMTGVDFVNCIPFSPPVLVSTEDNTTWVDLQKPAEPLPPIQIWEIGQEGEDYWFAARSLRELIPLLEQSELVKDISIVHLDEDQSKEMKINLNTQEAQSYSTREYLNFDTYRVPMLEYIANCSSPTPYLIMTTVN